VVKFTRSQARVAWRKTEAANSCGAWRLPLRVPEQRGFYRSRGVANFFYKDDLPDELDLGAVVAIDCETMGLNPHRDRLCLVQLSGGDGNAHLVQIAAAPAPAPNLCALLEDRDVLKLFHFGRFDIAAMYHAFGALAEPVYCTKIASKLTRTYTDRHGLKNLLQELLSVDISKFQQSSDWGAETLSEAQLNYAASDVLYLHQLRIALDTRLARENRSDLAARCFSFLPTRAQLDLAGWPEVDIFAH
jgi:ribonuclease D